MIFQAYFAEKNFEELQDAAMSGVQGLTDEEWKRFIAYVGGFYGNLSPYHSFGHMKFIPELDAEKFWGILRSHPKASEPDSPINWALANLVARVDTEVYAYDAPYNQINFPAEGGVTAYFSRNMTEADLAVTKQFLLTPEAIAKGLDILNTRVFKTGDDRFLLTVGSATNEGGCEMSFNGKTFAVQFGEFSEYCREMNSFL